MADITINHQNYEEYFLLYADGELSASDILAVENFVQENKGLAEELETIIQLRLPGEALVFGNKEGLFRTGTSGINLDNYEEYFLLYADNEISADAKVRVETFVLQHPALQETFTLTREARLPADKVIFPGKDSLYRKTEKKRDIFYLSWRMTSLAAAVMGFAFLVWSIFPVNNRKASLAASHYPAVSRALSSPSGAIQNTLAVVPSATKPTHLITSAISRSDKQASKQKIGNPARAGTADMVAERISPIPPGATAKSAGIIAREYKDAPELSIPARSGPEIKAVINAGMVTNNTVMAENNIVKPAVYRELDPDDEKKSLYLGSIEINKDKLRGFFRKAGSIFRSKSRQPDEEKSETTAPSAARSLK